MKKYKYICVIAIFLLMQMNNFMCTAKEELMDPINISQDNIAWTNCDLLGGEIEGISVCRVGETNLGNLIADALRTSTIQQLHGTQYEALPVVAIQNGGGIRQTIPKGYISKDQVDTVLPYNNFLVLHMVTPKLLYEIIENGVSRVFKDNLGNLTGIDGRFPQVSGMNFIYDYSHSGYNNFDKQSEMDERVLAIYLENEDQPLNKNDDKTNIILAFNNYCLDGRDGYTMLKSDNVFYSGDTLNNIVYQYIIDIAQNNNGIIEYDNYGRISLGEKIGKYREDIKVVLNYESLDLDAMPFINNFKVFIPMREIYEALGMAVSWNEIEKSIQIHYGEKKIVYFLNDKQVYVNEDIIGLNTSLPILNDRTMVTIEFLKKTLDLNIEWDSKYNSIIINKK